MDYPVELQENGIMGKGKVCFYVNSEGKVQDISFVESAHPALNAEVLKAIESMPVWEPTIVEGRPVFTRCVVPFSFSLR